MLQEPASTRADVHFQIGSIPVRVHPFFWLGAVLLGMRAGFWALPIWIGVVFVSILIHELGHAWAIRACGWEPKIVLWGMGGLAIHRPTYHDGKKQIGISLAGPGAGFVLAGVVIALLFATGHYVGFGFGDKEHPWIVWIGRGAPIANDNLDRLVRYLVFVNLFWGLINLVPVFPLDGGQVARELFSFSEPNSMLAMRKTLILSMVSCAVVGIAGWQIMGDVFLLILFGILGFASYMMLQQISGGGGGGFGGFGGGGYGGGYNDDYSDYSNDRDWR